MNARKHALQKNGHEGGEVERVYRILLEWVVTAELPPGAFLSEPELAQKCNTSRTPIREACSRLAQDGWLSLIRRKGWMVTPISVRDIMDVYEYRKVIECFTAEKAARSATREEIESLQKILEVENQPHATLPDILRANAAFHYRLAEISANRRILSELSSILRYVRRLDTLCTQTVPGWIGHGEIFAAITGHNPEKARAAMAVHIDVTVEKMVKLFAAGPERGGAEPAFLPPLTAPVLPSARRQA